jgi:rhodanese-related sulfurtransferase
MKTLDETVKEMTPQFFAEGKHGVTLALTTECIKNNGGCFFLDVRSEEEISCLKFNNVKNIPLNQLPDRIGELPDNCSIIVFCTSIVRASMAAFYLRAEGKKDVRTLLANSEDMVGLSFPSLQYQSSVDQPEITVVRILI